MGHQIAKRHLTQEQEDLVVDMYFNQRIPAWDVAAALGRPRWGQSDIYVLAEKLRKKRGLPKADRYKERLKIDWDLVHALRVEHMPWDDLAEFIGNAGASGLLKSGYHHRRSAGRFESGQ